MFTQFDLQSFSQGELDMSIEARPIVLPTEQERMETELLKVQVAAAREGIVTARELKGIYPDLDDATLATLAQERQAGMVLADFGPVDDAA